MTQWPQGLKSFEWEYVLRISWLTHIFHFFFSFSSPSLLILTTIYLCFFKVSNQANVYCIAQPTGDQSLSYIHGLPRRNFRDWSLEQMARSSSDQPKVCIVGVVELFSIVDEGVLFVDCVFRCGTIIRWSKIDWWVPHLICLISFPGSPQANLICSAWPLHLPSLFLLPDPSL